MPEDFLRQDFDATITAIIGYLDDKADDERILRRLGLMCVSPYIDHRFDIYKYWPIAGDDILIMETKGARQRKLLEELRKHKMDEYQRKVNG